MKKIIAGLLATIAVFGAVPNGNFIVPEKSAFIASALDLDVIGKGSEGNFSCEYLSDGSIIINGYFGTETEITIPDEINGHAVKYLNIIVYSDKEIFWAGVTKINITTNLTLISGRDYITSENAIKCFFDMGITANITGNVNQDAPPETPNEPIYELTSDTVLTIKGAGEIKNIPLDSEIKGKIVEVIIEDGIISIGSYAFSSFTSLSTINIPDSITTIGNSAFKGSGLISVNIPDSVTEIDSFVFAGCENLNEVTLPDSITSIGLSAFQSCESLEEITIPKGVIDIHTQAFIGCTNLKQIIVEQDNSYYASKDGVLFNKDMTTLIHYPSEKQETHYVIPYGVTNIGSFDRCDNLIKITIPETVTTISGFRNCTSLSEIAIPNSVTSIPNSAFWGCTNLTSITIPNSVTNIGSQVFLRCTNLSEIIIPESVTYIGNQTFQETAWYENQPDGVVYAGNNVYRYKGDMPENTEIILNDGTKSISDSAFQAYDNLVSITLPESLTYIGSRAFCRCENLTEITLPKNVESFEIDTFYGCSSLTKITIENPVCEIYDDSTTISDTATIYGYENSTAQAYAKKYNRKFVSLGEAPIEALPLGDINGDSTVDASDASNVLAVYALVSTGKESELTAEQIAAADVNKDGSIDASDASLILAYYAYISTGGTGTLEEYLNS